MSSAALCPPGNSRLRGRGESDPGLPTPSVTDAAFPAFSRAWTLLGCPARASRRLLLGGCGWDASGQLSCNLSSGMLLFSFLCFPAWPHSASVQKSVLFTGVHFRSCQMGSQVSLFSGTHVGFLLCWLPAGRLCLRPFLTSSFPTPKNCDPESSAGWCRKGIFSLFCTRLPRCVRI